MANPYRYEATEIHNPHSQPIVAQNSEELCGALKARHKKKEEDGSATYLFTAFLVQQIANDGTLCESFTLEATAQKVHPGWSNPKQYEGLLPDTQNDHWSREKQV